MSGRRASLVLAAWSVAACARSKPQADTVILRPQAEGSRSAQGDSSVAALPQDDTGRAVTHDDTAGTRVFTDGVHHFRFAYPSKFPVNASPAGEPAQNWRVNTTLRGHLLATLTVPRAFEPGTNFQTATFTVGMATDSSALATCRVATNGERAHGTTTIDGETFAAFDLLDAAAGNLYETMSYRTARDHACYAVEYTIHSTNLGNYDPKQGVKAFDEAKLKEVLNTIARSFAFTR